jgi:predicted nucleic acid-binding protein
MEAIKPAKPRIFIDADVLFAGAASPNEHSASNLILRMAELTLIEAITSTQVITEAERNLIEKIPKALPAFRLLVSRSLKIVEDPDPALLVAHHGLADPEDLPILVAAMRESCNLLTTFNARHYQPGHPSVTVLKPGDLVLRIRYLLANLPDRS